MFFYNIYTENIMAPPKITVPEDAPISEAEEKVSLLIVHGSTGKTSNYKTIIGLNQ